MLPKLLGITSDHPDYLPLLELQTQFGYSLTSLSTQELCTLLVYCSLRVQSKIKTELIPDVLTITLNSNNFSVFLSINTQSLADSIIYLSNISQKTIFNLITYIHTWINDRQDFTPK